jgi:hypothetical protein
MSGLRLVCMQRSVQVTVHTKLSSAMLCSADPNGDSASLLGLAAVSYPLLRRSVHGQTPEAKATAKWCGYARLSLGCAGGSGGSSRRRSANIISVSDQTTGRRTLVARTCDRARTHACFQGRSTYCPLDTVEPVANHLDDHIGGGCPACSWWRAPALGR